MQNTRKTAQEHAFDPVLTCLWEILCEPLLSKGQFRGFTHQLNGQFHGICLEESQPKERTFAGCAAPLERTFGRIEAPSGPSFSLILWDLTKHPTSHAKNAGFSTRPPLRSLAPCFSVPCSLFPAFTP
jgi:hypothetical protein